MPIDKLIGIPHITPLTPNDCLLFRKAFRNDDVCHANSWLYMLRTTRDQQGDLGYKYWGRGVLLGIGYRKGIVYLTRPIGKKRHDVITNLCEQISQNHQTKIILRRLDQDLFTSLKNTGQYKQIQNHEILEDDTYPETIVVVEKLLSDTLELSKYAYKLRKKARRFEKSFNKLFVRTDLSEKDLNPLIRAMYRMSENIHDKYTSYVPIVKDVLSNFECQRFYKSFVFYEGKTIHGIYIVEFLTSDKVGLYCALTSKAFPGITEWIDYYFFREMFEMGVRIVYLGGSETQGVYQYIKKLLPSFPTYKMFSLVYSPNLDNFANSND